MTKRNQSGTTEYYTLYNMLQWLTLVGSSSTDDIAPLKTKTLRFAVNPLVHVGNYDVTIGLQGNKGILEPLRIVMKVRGEKPDWAVDPTRYDHQMNIIGQVYIDGILMENAESMVAAFIGNECRGAVKATNGLYYLVVAGEEGGNAVADILYGKVSPSAKLAVSYPNTEIYEPICYNYPQLSNQESSNGEIVKSSNREIVQSSNGEIAWPFGYGLSYTTFEYSNLKVAGEASTKDESISLSFEVKNTGEMAADEVAQIYLSPTSADQPLRPIQLQGFARVSLQPGESATIQAKLYTEQFGFYSNEGQRQWNVQPGQYLIKVGSSSADIRLQQAVTLTGAPVQKPLRDHYFSTKF